MTDVNTKSRRLAISLVNRMWATNRVQTRDNFGSAQLQAIACKNQMLIAYKKGGNLDPEYHSVLTGLEKEIYSLKYKK